MWCPGCRSEYREGITVCPTCRLPLRETLEEETPEVPAEPEFLLAFQDQKELGMATALLDRAGIPWFCKEPGSGAYLRIVTGENMFGTELYVDRRCTHRALRLLRQFDREAQTPFDDDELERAVDEYMAENPEEAEREEADKPVSPEGYRLLLGFLAVFAALALLAFLLTR